MTAEANIVMASGRVVCSPAIPTSAATVPASSASVVALPKVRPSAAIEKNEAYQSGWMSARNSRSYTSRTTTSKASTSKSAPGSSSAAASAFDTA